MSNGVLTTQIADSLQKEFGQQGFDILHDHGKQEIDLPEKVGKLRSWSGSTLKSEMVLADLDIAIVSQHDKKIYTLIEIEETNDKPKVILGDIVATLLGKGIAFKGKLDLQVGAWTTLIVMVYESRQSHIDRLAFLSEQTNILKSKLTTPNAMIGRIIIDAFSNKVQIEYKLRQHISEIVSQRGIQLVV